MDEVRAARWSLLVQFALFGLIMSSWLSRMPSIREALDVDAAQLGALMIVGGAGSLTGALTIGVVVARFGSRRALLAGTVGNVVGFGAIAVATATGDVRFFIAGAFVNGFCGALVNVPINTNAAEVERRVGTAILPHFHACFSIGAAVGALVGAAFAAAHVSITVQILVVLAAVTATRLALLRPATALTLHVPITTETGSIEQAATKTRNRGAVKQAVGAWLEPRTLLLGVVLLAASLAEGTATTWLALAVVDGFATVEAAGALAYGTFVGAMTVFRFLGTPLIDRFGRVAVLRVSGLATFTGVLVFVFSPSLATAWIGVLLWGCGAALGNPIAISAASDDPDHAGPRVAVVTSFSTVSSLAAPPLLGLLASEVGARHAVLVVAAVAVVSFAVAAQARRRPLPTPAEVDEVAA
ncbi:fucose permease [Agromyces terreus]|uniref:Fucose permease n=1 Tax=Agromyces terreus TaxID=424795 RepID=A0A9X2H567_9MICO|nr:MFS transporter [Agromyces terreus]MCP2370982.1 fucose permease [Agromyces terreus]